MLHIGLQTGSRFILQQSVGLPNARNKFGSYLVPTTGFSTAPYKGIEGEFWDACENPMLLCQKQELFGVFPPLCKSMKLSYQLLAKMANSGNIPFPCFWRSPPQATSARVFHPTFDHARLQQDTSQPSLQFSWSFTLQGTNISYPTLGKEKSSSNIPQTWGYVILPRRGPSTQHLHCRQVSPEVLYNRAWNSRFFISFNGFKEKPGNSMVFHQITSVPTVSQNW